MLLYMYIASNNIGLISIIIVMSVFTLVVFSVRLEECGSPDWVTNGIKMCKNICRDRLVDDNDTDSD